MWFPPYFCFRFGRRRLSGVVHRRFGQPLQVTVRPMLWDHSPVCPVCPVCNVGVFWPSGWMNQGATWYGDKWVSKFIKTHLQLSSWIEVGLSPDDIVLDGDNGKSHGSPSPLFVPCLLWPNCRSSHQLLSSCKVLQCDSHLVLSY